MRAEGGGKETEGECGKEPKKGAGDTTCCNLFDAHRFFLKAEIRRSLGLDGFGTESEEEEEWGFGSR